MMLIGPVYLLMVQPPALQQPAKKGARQPWTANRTTIAYRDYPKISPGEGGLASLRSLTVA